MGLAHSKHSRHIMCDYHYLNPSSLIESLVLWEKQQRPGEGKGLVEVAWISRKIMSLE